MTDFQRLIYASRATFIPSERGLGIELEVARIVMQARRNNARLGLVGALYYSDGCFFQCLEGVSDGIDALFERIAHDPRHSDMKVLGRHPIAGTSFSDWSMKFVPKARAVQDLLGRHHLKQFDPYAFDKSLIVSMINLLRSQSDVDLLDIDKSGTRHTADPPREASANAHTILASKESNSSVRTGFFGWFSGPRQGKGNHW